MGIFGYQVTSLQDVEDQSTEDEALKKQMNDYELLKKMGQRLVDLLCIWNSNDLGFNWKTRHFSFDPGPQVTLK